MLSKCMHLVLSLFVAPILGVQFRCDYTYIKDGDGYFKFMEMPSNYHEARLRCNLEGGNLASPINPGLASAMKSLISQNNVNCALLTGIHASFSRGNFFSVEGVPLSKTPHSWAEGEPNNLNNRESCIAMLPDGSIADVGCNETFPYICYAKNNNNSMVMNSCGTTDNAYTFDARTGSCYKFHNLKRTWSRAFMTCTAEGGHLAIINSETEAQVIRDIYAKVPNRNPKSAAFIGFQDWGERGEWFTIEGKSLTKAGYEKWEPNEPNNDGGIQFCGGVFPSGLFDDHFCERLFPFICEKSPDSLLCDHEK